MLGKTPRSAVQVPSVMGRILQVEKAEHAPGATNPQRMEIKMKSKKTVFPTDRSFLFTILLLSGILIIFGLRNISADRSSDIEGCRHCHGKDLKGIHNTAATCSSCHTIKPFAVSQVTSQEKKKSLLMAPHIHKTKKLFSSTPSCYSCHRPGKF